MRVRPLLARLRTLVLEHGHVFEACIALQVVDPRCVGFEHAFDFLIRQLRERARMARRLDDDLVRADGRHAVENPVGAASGVALDAVERAEVRIHANLPWPARRQLEQNLGSSVVFRAERARALSLLFAFWMAGDYPTASDRVLA